MSLRIKQAGMKISNTHLCFSELHYRPQFRHHLVPYLDKGNLTYRETKETHTQ